jgi:hypothetical protein
MLSGALILEVFYAPEAGSVQRVIDSITGGIVILAGVGINWWYVSSASSTQSAATIAEQSRLLAATNPVFAPEPISENKP